MVRSKLICLAVLLLAVSVLTMQSASAQAVYGSIIGTATDPQGAVVPNAKITVTNQSKNTSDTTTTNESGNYSVSHLVPDAYTVRAEAPGFKATELKDVLVSADASASVPLQLQIGGTAETVEVTAEAPQLKTDRADVAYQFNEKYVQDLPILNRNFTQIQLLSPGSQKLTGWGHAATENPQGGQQIFTQGQHFSGTGFLLDGTDNQDPILGIIVINPNLDAVTEAKVALQNYDAEFGKAVASLVTAQTRSGSNQIHGSGFLFDRRDRFQARDPFTQSKRDALTNRFIPKAKWQQFGGTIGGAIIKDKLFFFGDYQGTRQTNGVSGNFTVPTANAVSTCLQATGFCDLSQYAGVTGAPLTGGLIFDPNTGNLSDGTGRMQFCGPAGCATQKNFIPITAADAISVGHPAASHLSPAAQNILALFPAPATSAVLNNFSGSGSGPFKQDSFDTRIDYSASQSVTIFGRYSLSHYSLSGTGLLNKAGGIGLGGPGNGLLGLSGSSITHNQSLATGFNKTFSSSLLMDFRFGYFKYNPVASKPTGGQPMTALGIPNANTSDAKTNGLGSFILGPDPISGENGTASKGEGLVISSFGDGLGIARCNCPLTESEQQFQFVNNWTKIRGNHQFKVGADIRYAMNLRIPSDNNRTGEYNFSPEATSNGGIGGLDFASFLLGEVTNIQRYANNPAAGGSPAERQKRWFFYGQDTWRVTSKLTLNYGVRWEIYFPETVNGKGAGGFANIVDNGGQGGIRVGGYGPYGLNGNISNDFKAFAPRLGIAYQLTPKTVVRMGYGRSYDIGVFGSNFGHTVTQNLPVLLKQNLKASNLLVPTSDDLTPVFILDNGPPAPNFGTGIPSNGLIPLTSDLSGTHIRPVKQVLPAVDAWNVTVQRQVTNTVSAEVSYVGSKGSHGFAGNGPNYDVNPVAVGSGVNLVELDPSNPGHNKLNGFSPDLSQNARRPLCGTFDPILGCSRIGFDLGNYYGNDASSNYNAFEVKVDKRFSSGLQLLSHYTYSHAVGYNDNYYAISHRIAHGPADFNRNSVFVLNTVYELPIGKGKKFMGNSSRAMDYLVGGWGITNTTNWSSGLPWTPSIGECGNLTDAGPCRPNLSGSFHTGVGSLDPVNHSRTFFTPVGALAYPLDATPVGTDSCSLDRPKAGPFTLPACGALGNSGLNVFHGPAGFYSDLSVSKSFRITERARAKFVFDAFNVFNHGVYAFSANNGANNCVDCGGDAGKIKGLEGGTSMRALQFAVRFDF